jgi:hypothetical protein
LHLTKRSEVKCLDFAGEGRLLATAALTPHLKNQGLGLRYAQPKPMIFLPLPQGEREEEVKNNHSTKHTFLELTPRHPMSHERRVNRAARIARIEPAIFKK